VPFPDNGHLAKPIEPPVETGGGKLAALLALGTNTNAASWTEAAFL